MFIPQNITKWKKFKTVKFRNAKWIFKKWNEYKFLHLSNVYNIEHDKPIHLIIIIFFLLPSPLLLPLFLFSSSSSPPPALPTSPFLLLFLHPTIQPWLVWNTQRFTFTHWLGHYLGLQKDGLSICFQMGMWLCKVHALSLSTSSPR